LKIHINHLAILIHGSPQVVLLAIDFDEHFIDVESVTIASVSSFQSSSVYRSEFDAPESDGLSADSDAPLSEQVLDIPMAEIKSIVEPDGVGDDIGRESVAFVCVYPPILAISAI
jgi:hypothetical protein